MSTAILTQRFDFFRLVGKLFSHKNLQKCEKRQSNESSYLHSLLQQEPFSGHKLPNLRLSSTLPTDVTNVFPDTADGQNVTSKPSSRNPLRSFRNKDDDNRNKLDLRSNLKSFLVRLSNTLLSFWVNPRLRTGLILLLIIAPASKFFYLIFPVDGLGEYVINNAYLKIPNVFEPDGWYFYSLYYFWFSISEFLTPILSTLGVFFLFPKNYYPSYLCGIPLGYYLSLLINRVSVKTDADFHSGAGFTLVLITILFAAFLLYISDKILFRKNHRQRSIEARIIGLINMPGVSWEDKEELLKKEAKDAVKEDNELFIRVG